ncbi:MAG: hypothetical protein IPL91_15005 [Hyphomicrobium sp.]|nr:hypothetical protein [Hyphomicrobium sp.]
MTFKIVAGLAVASLLADAFASFGMMGLAGAATAVVIVGNWLWTYLH